MQKTRQQFCKALSRYWNIKDFCILYSPFWEEMFIMDNS